MAWELKEKINDDDDNKCSTYLYLLSKSVQKITLYFSLQHKTSNHRPHHHERAL